MQKHDMVKMQEAVMRLHVMHGLETRLRDCLGDVILRLGEARSLPAHARFLKEGESADDKGFVLVEGTLAIRRSDRPEVICDAPELLGEMQQFNPLHARTATVSSVTPCVVLRFHWTEFWETLDREFAPEDIELIREALKAQAWEHFTE